MKETLLEKFCKWASSVFVDYHKIRVELYLAEATDLCDLERRIRRLELGRVI